MYATILCLASTTSDAEKIVRALHEDNVSRIAVFVHPKFHDERDSLPGLARPAGGPPSVVRGAVQGGTAGGLVSAAALALPFVGPFVFALSAPFAAAAGAALGAAMAAAAGPDAPSAARLTSALGVSETEAPRFERALDAGHAVIAVPTVSETEAVRVEHVLIALNAEAVTRTYGLWETPTELSSISPGQ